MSSLLALTAREKGAEQLCLLGVVVRVFADDELDQQGQAFSDAVARQPRNNHEQPHRQPRRADDRWSRLRRLLGGRFRHVGALKLPLLRDLLLN